MKPKSIECLTRTKYWLKPINSMLNHILITGMYPVDPLNSKLTFLLNFGVEEHMGVQVMITKFQRRFSQICFFILSNSLDSKWGLTSFQVETLSITHLPLFIIFNAKSKYPMHFYCLR